MKVKLGDVSELINGDRGKNYPSQGDITEMGEVPFVNAGHLNGRCIDFSEMNYISQEKYDKLTSGKFQKDDILYCLRGSLGKKARVGEAIYGAIASSLVIIRPDTTKAISDYLMFALDSAAIKEQLTRANNGSSQPNLSAASVREYQIELPEISTQYDVVGRLQKSRAIIDARRQQLMMLDELVKARFVETFGDPVINPNGWIKLKVSEAVEQGYIERPLDGNHGEKHPKADDYVPTGIPFLMAIDLKNNRVDFDNCHFITKEQASTLTKGWAREGDVLLTHKGTIGKVAIVQRSQYEDMLLTPQITYYRCLNDLDNRYLAAYFGTPFFVDQMRRLITGSTRAYVTITQQENLELIIPPLDMQKQFAAFVAQVDKSKLQERTSCQTLSS